MDDDKYNNRIFTSILSFTYTHSIKREHRCWNKQGEDTSEDLLRVRNEDTPQYQIEYVDKNMKIFDSIFIFKEDAPIEKRMADL